MPCPIWLCIPLQKFCIYSSVLICITVCGTVHLCMVLFIPQPYACPAALPAAPAQSLASAAAPSAARDLTAVRRGLFPLAHPAPFAPPLPSLILLTHPAFPLSCRVCSCSPCPLPLMGPSSPIFLSKLCDLPAVPSGLPNPPSLGYNTPSVPH